MAEEHELGQIFVIFPLLTSKSHWRQNLERYGAVLGVYYQTVNRTLTHIPLTIEGL